MIIALTGAGISAPSGIPTFQAQPGIRRKLTRPFANKHPEEHREVIRQMTEACRKAEPNDAHYALAEYHIPVITMNVDELHQKAGSAFVLPIHGSLPEDPSQRILLARAIQECAANAVKHAEGDRLDIRLEENEGNLLIRISNNGKPPKGPVTESGGLLSLRRSVEEAKGSMAVESSPAFALILRLPANP